MHTKEKGDIGESIASTYLEKRGYTVIERNYRKRWGEIDIIAKKNGLVHFIEVKSVTRPLLQIGVAAHRPEDNVDTRKGARLCRMIETYFAEKYGGACPEFHFHVLCVYLDMNIRKARIKWIKDVVL